jgi:hypothetical protein
VGPVVREMFEEVFGDLEGSSGLDLKGSGWRGSGGLT